MVDIRDFFGSAKKPAAKVGSSTAKTKTPVKPKQEAPKKKRVIADSDEEDIEILDSPPKKTKKRLVETSSSEYFQNKSKKPVATKIMSQPVVMPQKAVSPKKTKKKVVSLDSDDMDFDDGDFDDNFEDSEDEFKPDGVDEEDDEVMEIDDQDEDEKEIIVQKVATPRKRAPRTKSASPKKETLDPEPMIIDMKPKKPAVSPQKSAFVATGKTAEEVLKSIPDAHLPDDEDTTGKSFRDFKARQANLPQVTGTIELPEAAPDCLSGLTIVFTGVLPNLDRGSSENLAKRYGAKVTKSISSKTSLVVLGDEAGPSKVKKIKTLGIKAIDQEGFILLLEAMPIGGGDGLAAQKARDKREEEDRKILEQAEEDDRKEKALEQKRIKEEKERNKQIAMNSETPVLVTPSMKSNDEKLWTTKYAPSDLTHLCGNKGAILKLKSWLENWFDNAKQDFKNPGRDGSGIYRACLISGSPGIGKTSAAHLIAESLGYDILEKNASDVRSKSLLNSTIKSVLNNTSVVGFFHQRDENNSAESNGNKKKFVLIMDEVDGMSSGDHGGAGQLSAFCRITKMPMILICNDKSLPKMRTFDRVTLDIPFRKPSETEVKARLLTIAHREKIKLDPSVIGQLVQSTNHDMRQMINLMSTISKTQKNFNHANTKDIAESWQKHVILKPFDIIAKFLSGATYSPNSSVSLNDKIELYFNDIDFAPLMVQENYLATKPSRARTSLDHLELVAQAADSISESDRVNALIRSGEQQWSLLPFHAIMSSVRPCSYIAGSVTQRYNFSSWLGQNSKQMKYQRILQELQYHTRLRTSTDKPQLRLEYIPRLVTKLTQPILDHDGIDEVIEMLDYYYLSKEDWEFLLEFGVGPQNSNDILKKIPTKTKTAFTRQYNSGSHPVAIYKTGNSVGKQTKKEKVDYEDVVDDDMDDNNNGDEDEDTQNNDVFDPKKDKLIKEVKPKKKAAAKTTKKASAKKK